MVTWATPNSTTKKILTSGFGHTSKTISIDARVQEEFFHDLSTNDSCGCVADHSRSVFELGRANQAHVLGGVGAVQGKRPGSHSPRGGQERGTSYVLYFEYLDGWSGISGVRQEIPLHKNQCMAQ